MITWKDQVWKQNSRIKRKKWAIIIIVWRLLSVCEVLGYLASYWQRPFLPESCRDPAFDNSRIYSTTIRSAGSWSSVGQVVETLMNQFSWRHLTVFSDQQPDLSKCSHGATGIVNWFAELNSTNCTIYSFPFYDNPSDKELDYYLTFARNRSRGKYLLLSSHILTVLQTFIQCSCPPQPLNICWPWATRRK
jgi:Receptor family ligand binding region